ncbi:hypothetical protein OF83DRAFT_1113068 [Amylostereum chailletii]|nr:hypothetical protein OF83DRAFT_1113068 [Amylostereum chailletii]
MGTYKTIRCRYFNDDGQPIKPYCNQGSRCSFIHPEDTQWSRKKPHSSAYHDKNRPYPRTSPSVESRRHLSPLAPQSAVFKKSTHEDEPPTLAPGKGTSARDEKAMDVRADFGNHSPSSYDRGDRDAVPQEFLSSLQRLTSASQPSNVPPAPGLLTKLTPYKSEMAMERVADSFKNIAKITNQAIHDSAEYDKEDEKLRAYQELSTTLARISPSSAAAIAPSLTAVISNHAKYRDKVNTDFKRLARAWENVFELFVDATSRSIDAKVEDALLRIRDEADHQVKRIEMQERAPPPKRKFDEDWDSRPSQYHAESSRTSEMHGYDRSPDYKRTRQSSPPRSREHDERIATSRNRDERSFAPPGLLSSFEQRPMRGNVGDQSIQTNIDSTSTLVCRLLSCNDPI